VAPRPGKKLRDALANLKDSITNAVADGLDGRPNRPERLAALLGPAEQEALLARARALVSDGRFPVQSGGRDYPWPLV